MNEDERALAEMARERDFWKAKFVELRPLTTSSIRRSIRSPDNLSNRVLRMWIPSFAFRKRCVTGSR